MKIVYRFILLIQILLCWHASQATTLERLTFEELVDHTQLIIEARVSASRIIETDALVYTRVTFDVLDVLKGDCDTDAIELDYMGGSGVKGKLSISGQDIPQVGDRGFYFIEKQDRNAVNPLTGWSQGQFKIATDFKGHETLVSEISQDIIDVSAQKNSVLANKIKNMKFGNQLVEKAYYKPVTPNELRNAVIGILENSN